jgi:hypothetical protein
LLQINTGIPDNGYAGTPPIRASFNVRNLNYGDRSARATIRSPVAVFPFGVPGMWGYRPLIGLSRFSALSTTLVMLFQEFFRQHAERAVEDRQKSSYSQPIPTANAT